MHRSFVPCALALLVHGACAARGQADPPPAHEPPAALPSEAELAKLPADGGPEFNRLVFESSPYLRQHARNRVDWYPWGPAAFERAKREGKVVFLSIGYATCHWCHVMERESFHANEDVGARLDRDFIAIKVDREERPDVDAVYMTALHATGRRGGWPLTMFLLPDGRPFHGGTYLPPADQDGRIGLASLLDRVALAWRDRRPDVEAQAGTLAGALASEFGAQPEAAPLAGVLDAAFAQLVREHDATHGGFGHAPKFPQAERIGVLLRHAHRHAESGAREIALLALDKMAAGGIHDHLAGGFHRYSTDERWLLPHFEKMLYDQATLAVAYSDAFLATGESRCADVARRILDFVLAALAHPDGGFYAAYDADSEGEEGRYYVWTLAEVVTVLGPARGEAFARAYGIVRDGNVDDEASGMRTGANVLHLPRSLEETARALERDPGELAADVSRGRAELLAVRARRVPPALDDKVLADWNGLIIAALARSGRALEETRYLDAARSAMRFVQERMRAGDGRLLHTWRAGKASVPAFLEDHAFLAWGAFELYQATGEVRWLTLACELADAMLARFWDDKRAAFAQTAHDAEALVARPFELAGGAIPSGAEVAIDVLLRLGRLTGRARYAEHARRTLERYSGAILAHPPAFGRALAGLDYDRGPSVEIVLAGTSGDPGLAALRREVDRRYLPRAVVATNAADDAALAALAPGVAALPMREGRATAYVCENFACQLPVTDPAALAKLLDALVGK